MNTVKLLCLNVPNIIERAKLKIPQYDKSKYLIIRAKSQLKILKENNFQCSKCGAKDNLTIDHTNGLKTKRNSCKVYSKAKCTILCEKCHLEKNREEEENDKR